MKYIVIIAGFALIFVLVVLVEILIAKHDPPKDSVTPPLDQKRFGNGERPLQYVVMGDSTAAGEGAAYEYGIAVRSAKHLASSQAATVMSNLGKSGAKTHDVLENQLPDAVDIRPDLVLISTGANDVTSLTSPQKAKKDLKEVVNRLIEANCQVKIVITGAPDMGAVPRFAQPLRFLAGFATTRYNRTVLPVAEEEGVTLAPIARETGPSFRQNPNLFAEDRFHPNEKGYEIWANTVNPRLDEALNAQPAHCDD